MSCITGRQYQSSKTGVQSRYPQPIPPINRTIHTILQVKRNFSNEDLFHIFLIELFVQFTDFKNPVSRLSFKLYALGVRPLRFRQFSYYHPYYKPFQDSQSFRYNMLRTMNGSLSTVLSHIFQYFFEKMNHFVEQYQMVE